MVLIYIYVGLSVYCQSTSQKPAGHVLKKKKSQERHFQGKRGLFFHAALILMHEMCKEGPDHIMCQTSVNLIPCCIKYRTKFVLGLRYQDLTCVDPYIDQMWGKHPSSYKNRQQKSMEVRVGGEGVGGRGQG